VTFFDLVDGAPQPVAEYSIIGGNEILN